MTETEKVYVRVWFWGERNPTPRIVAHGDGPTVEAAARGCFVPLWDRSWATQTDPETGDLYLFRREAGYCVQQTAKDSLIRPPRPGIRRVRKRLVRKTRETVVKKPRKRLIRKRLRKRLIRRK